MEIFYDAAETNMTTGLTTEAALTGPNVTVSLTKSSAGDQDIRNGAIIGAGLFVLICLITILVVTKRRKFSRGKTEKGVTGSSDQHPGTSSAVHWTNGSANVTLSRNATGDSALGYVYPSTTAIVTETDDDVIEDINMAPALSCPNLDPSEIEPDEDQEEYGIYVDVESTENTEIGLGRELTLRGVGRKTTEAGRISPDEIMGRSKQINPHTIAKSRSESSISAGFSDASRLRDRRGLKWEVTVPITHKESECIGNRESAGVYIDMSQSSPTKRISLTPPSPTCDREKEQPHLKGSITESPLPPPPCGATSKHQYVNTKNGDPRTLNKQNKTLDLQKFSDNPSGYCFAHGLADPSEDQHFTDDENDLDDDVNAVYEIPGGNPLNLKFIIGQRESFPYQNLQNQISLTDDFLDDPPDEIYIVPTSPLANTPKTPDSDDGNYENPSALLFEAKLKSHLSKIEALKKDDTSTKLVKKIPPPVMPKPKNTKNGAQSRETPQPLTSVSDSESRSNHYVNGQSREQKSDEENRDSGLGLEKTQRQQLVYQVDQQARNLVTDETSKVNNNTPASDSENDDDNGHYVNVSEIVK